MSNNFTSPFLSRLLGAVADRFSAADVHGCREPRPQRDQEQPSDHRQEREAF